VQTFAAIRTDIVQEIAQTRQNPLLERKVSLLNQTEDQNLAGEFERGKCKRRICSR